MESIGKYTDLEKIGRGAMGVVYRAYDAFLDRTVAIKMMSADLDDESHFRERFFREARVAVQLEHANIVKIHDLAEDDGRAYIVMEYLDGEDLGETIKRIDAVPLERRLDIMRQIADALAYAHRHEVIHRDIKPGNIQITADGGVKILDFGLARITDSTMTATGALLGTPSYMSPEQVGGQPADLRSDVFSAGALFYELLSGQRPFTGDGLPEIFQKIAHEEASPIDELNPLLPRELSAIIDKSMAKSVDDRYQSMEELGAALKHFDDTLERARQKVREEAATALRALRALHQEHLPLLARPGFVDDPDATLKDDRLNDGGAAEIGGLAVESALPDGYLELHTFVRLASVEHQRTKDLVERLRLVVDRSTVPVEQESDEELRKLTTELDSVLTSYPGHPATQEYRVRLVEELRRRQREALVAKLMDTAREQHAAGALDELRATLGRVLEIDPEHEPGVVLQQDVERQIEEERRREEKQRRVGEALQAARQALAADSLVAARAAAETALELDPEADGAAALLAEVEALEVELGERRRRQQDLEGMLHDARELADAGREEEALVRLEELFEVEPEAEEAQALRQEIDRRLAIRAEERQRHESEREQREEHERRRQEERERDRLERVEQRLKLAAAAMEAGEAEEVLELAASVLDDEPEHPDALALRDRARAELAELRKQTAEAVRLTRELQAAAASGEKRQPSVPSPGVWARRNALAAAALVALALLVWAVWPEAAPVGPVEPVAPTTGTLVIDATPWARIRSIIDAEGNDVTPAGAADSTPLAVELPAGTYSVRLWYAATDEIVDLPAEIGVGEISRAAHTFETITAAAYFDGEWWR